MTKRTFVVAVSGRGVSLFLLNRDLKQDIGVNLDIRGFGRFTVTEAQELRHADLKTVNSKAEPNKIAPAPLEEISVDGSKVRVGLKPASWNVVHLSAA